MRGGFTRASCPHPFGADLRSFWIVPDDPVKTAALNHSATSPNCFRMMRCAHARRFYSGFLPSPLRGRPAVVLYRSRRSSTRASCPRPCGADLRSFWIVPDDPVKTSAIVHFATLPNSFSREKTAHVAIRNSKPQPRPMSQVRRVPCCSRCARLRSMVAGVRRENR